MGCCCSKDKYHTFFDELSIPGTLDLTRKSSTEFSKDILDLSPKKIVNSSTQNFTFIFTGKEGSRISNIRIIDNLHNKYYYYWGYTKYIVRKIWEVMNPANNGSTTAIIHTSSEYVTSNYLYITSTHLVMINGSSDNQTIILSQKDRKRLYKLCYKIAKYEISPSKSKKPLTKGELNSGFSSENLLDIK